MITLNLKPYCEECPEFEVMDEDLTFDEDDTTCHVITCKHIKKCDSIDKFLRKELKKEKENGWK